MPTHMVTMELAVLVNIQGEKNLEKKQGGPVCPFLACLIQNSQKVVFLPAGQVKGSLINQLKKISG